MELVRGRGLGKKCVKYSDQKWHKGGIGRFPVHCDAMEQHDIHDSLCPTFVILLNQHHLSARRLCRSLPDLFCIDLPSPGARYVDFQASEQCDVTERL